MERKELLAEMIPPLLYWYQGAARDLPWRCEPTPYHVWISEIMLQQTRVEAVKGYYERFLAAFPTVQALAEADDDALNKVWQGLGYYSRAKNLKKAAGVVVSQHGGALPADHGALLALPGIGAYTAGAICSIAFGQPTPAVDGNVLRVISRLCLYGEDILKQSTKDAVTAALAEVYPQTPEEASMMTQALMELGATVCAPNGAPHCGECPLASMCLAHRDGCEQDYPHKAPKRARVREERTVFVLRCGDRYAIAKRPPKGLLSGLWELPNTEGHLDTDAADLAVRAWGMTPQSLQPLDAAKHIFTHIEWHMTGYHFEIQTPSDAFVWASAEEIAAQYSVPSAFRAYLAYIVRENGG